MARILIIDSNEGNAKALALALERHRYSVTVCTEGRDVIDVLKRDRAGFDAIVLDLTANRPEDWATFDHIRKIAWVIPHTPRIVCFSTVNRGPQMKLKVERKGGRFTYEQ
jgi:CheY-like chemotaxis protein